MDRNLLLKSSSSKEKYSLNTKIPIIKSSEDLNSNYMQFAIAPRRVGSSDSASLEEIRSKHTSEVKAAAKILPDGMNASLSEPKNDLKILDKNGRLSPIRRSGSPIRRQHIHEIEQESSKKRNTTSSSPTKATTKRMKTVSFNDHALFEGPNEVPSLKQMTPTAQRQTTVEEIDSIDDMKNFIFQILDRLTKVEATQRDIISKVENSNEHHLNKQIVEMNEIIQQLKDSIKTTR
ncbi:uncharacterized protein PRCAT00001168001 [Priceomyces carsonii]|uniref:uncharacterized protein n=1 Tax=Priceomyces carsonii TaxID=28549 RepID=UPI002EDA26D4|nr:unnamed protein product [Priceomyces carsonii]